MNRILITGAMVFDGTGADRFAADVLVEDNRIAAVLRAGEPGPNLADVPVIDGTGHTLMPGLVEAHAHLTWPTNIERTINSMKLPLEEHVLVTAQNARILLDHGFTSAYSAGSLGERIEPALRDMIDAGHMPGPRLRASALEKGAEGVMGVPAGHDAVYDRGAAELADYVRAKKAEGCDTIKFLLSSDDGFAPGGAQMLMYSDEELAAIGAAAEEAGIWLACHAQAAEAVKRAVRHGFRAIYHCTYADEEALDLMEAARDRVFYAPAPGLLWARCHEAAAFGIGPAEAEKMGATYGLEAMARLIPEMRRRDIRVLPGGDYGFPYNPTGRNARDLALFVDLFGFSPSEALVAATKWGGELMGMDVGLVQPGMLADLLLVEGDPTADVTILQDKARIAMVMQDGRLHRGAALAVGRPPRCD